MADMKPTEVTEGLISVQNQKFEYILPPEYAKRAKEELGENPDTILMELQTFREKVEELENINTNMNDVFLLGFLRTRKFNRERAFNCTYSFNLINEQRTEKPRRRQWCPGFTSNLLVKRVHKRVHQLKNFFDLKKKNPDLFEPAVYEKVKHIHDMNIFNILADRDALGRAVAIGKLGNIDPKKCTTDELLNVFYNFGLAIAQDQKVQVAGIVAISDFAGVNLSMWRLLTPRVISASSKMIQETFPIRSKAFHLINVPSYIGAIYALFKPFLSAKIRNRVFIHGRINSNFDENLIPEIMPVEYGGLKRIDNSPGIELLKSSEETLKEILNYGYK